VEREHNRCRVNCLRVANYPSWYLEVNPTIPPQRSWNTMLPLMMFKPFSELSYMQPPSAHAAAKAALSLSAVCRLAHLCD
jgi:hypothetical protein